MVKYYNLDVDGTSYVLSDEGHYWTLLQALNILKSVAFLDSTIERVMGIEREVFDREFVDSKALFKPIVFDYDYSIDDEEKHIEEDALLSFLAHRDSLEELYKSLVNYLPDNLKELISSEGIPFKLFSDNRMDLEYHLPCKETNEETRRYVSDSRKEFYTKYYQKLEKFVELAYVTDPFKVWG